MSAKAIREYDGKRLLAANLTGVSDRVVQVTADVVAGDKPEITFESIAWANPWLLESKLVVKPDQLIKRRGKAGLIGVNLSWEEVQAWITERVNKTVRVEAVEGILSTFIVEEFCPHPDADEYYLCIQSHRLGEQLLFHHEGGVDVGDVDAKALKLEVPIADASPTAEAVTGALLAHVPAERQPALAAFILELFAMYRELHFVYCEINPLVYVAASGGFAPLDLAAKIDETAHFLAGARWGAIDFPAPFGRPEFPEEAYIRELDSKTGASLKLTILNHTGRIWTMVAGGGASVVYADTISDLGYGSELANYGEYSGAPSEDVTYQYARTILSLMVRAPEPRGKVLIIGGGIANFTDVAATFTGIIKALTAFTDELKSSNIRVYVRRGGPNYQEGLNKMRDCGAAIGVPIEVYGPETHIVSIVPMALAHLKDIAPAPGAEAPKAPSVPERTAQMKEMLSRQQVVGAASSPGLSRKSASSGKLAALDSAAASAAPASAESDAAMCSSAANVGMSFDATTRCIVYGMQTRAIQGMLDFDHLCKRDKPSVAAVIFPFGSNHYTKFYFGTKDILMPVYQDMDEALRKHPEVSCLINFSSYRSVYPTTLQALDRHAEQLSSIAIIAEGVPEAQTRELNQKAAEKGVGMIGPATVGGIKPGCFRIGNTGGMLDNIIDCKLYRPGSVAYVSKSGGMSNELNNIISRTSDGVCEGVAIGGDRYPGSKFIDHLLRYQDNPDVKMLVLLGEVGGVDEYDVCRAISSGRLTKPLIAWCIGTCAKIFPFEVQFGHAGALARGDMETAAAKNEALAMAGAFVPRSFDEFGSKIEEVYKGLVESGAIVPKEEGKVPSVPMDFAWAKKMGMIRKPTAFISTISDDRGEELTYCGKPISEVFAEDLGVGGVLSLLWFKRQLPAYASKFIEMVLMVTADHGPAVSGAHNTIVTARAGKDLISSLVSGLLTIGPRFGGALDKAAVDFAKATDSGVAPKDFVSAQRKANQLIMGIGHKIKSVTNPDMRVKIIVEYAKANFEHGTPILDFALAVEAVTTQKKENLILNVDGAIACCFVDLLRGLLPREDVAEAINNGCLNGLFVLGRSIGFIGHFLDQKRLKQGLYRHPTDDISYFEG